MGKFEISLESLEEVERLLAAEFAKGLESERENVQVKMFVHKMPEEGEFLVVDLGVKHLRVLHIGELTFTNNVEIHYYEAKRYT